jgi:hypothetical protein
MYDNFCVRKIKYIVYNVQDYISFFMITLFARLYVRVDMFARLYVRVDILLTSVKHWHDLIISLS